MPQLDSDSFTYSDGALQTVSGGKWTKLTNFATMNVASNQLQSSTTGDCASVITTWAGSTTDHYSQAVVATAANSSGVTVRSDAVQACYLLSCQPSGSLWEIYEVVSNAVQNLLNSVSQVTSAGDVIYLEAKTEGGSGVRLISKRNGNIVNNVFDATPAFASGKPGIMCFNSTQRLDTWAAGDFAGGADDLSVGSIGEPVVGGSTF
jgi:hypothetical protein